MTSTHVAAAAAGQDAGWGRLIALALTALAFWAFTAAHKRWKQVKDIPSKTHSSGPPELTVNTVKPQADAGVTVDHGEAQAGRAVVVRAAPTAHQKRDDGVDEFVRLRLKNTATTQLVREVENQFKVSTATAWRAVRRVRDSQAPAGAP